MFARLFAIFLAASCATTTLADEPAQTSLNLEISDVSSMLVLGNDRYTRLRIDVKVTVTNLNEAPFSVSPRLYRLNAAGVSLEPSGAAREDSLNKTKLALNESASGWLTFGPIAYNGPEIPLTFEMFSTGENNEEKNEAATPEETSGTPVKLFERSLNESIRKIHRFEISYVGADRELAVMSVHHTMDIFSTWTLCDHLKQIVDNGCQRIVLTPARSESPALHSECMQFLSTLVETPASNAIDTPSLIPYPRANVKLKHVSLANFSETSERAFRNPRWQIAHHRTLDDAVCTALTPIYRFVPVEKAVADLRNPDGGVRRAAMAGAADRLTAEQARAIIEQAQSGSKVVKVEIATYMNLIPGPEAVEALREMCLHEDEDVARVALQSLVRSQDDAAEAAMAEVWKAGATTPKLQSDVVQAISEFPDDRWMPLVVDYVLVFLRQAAQLDSATIPSKNISGALRFLSTRNESRIEQAIRRDLLNVRNPSIQDMFVQHLLSLNTSGNDSLLRECVTRRLREGQVSAAICTAAIRYRNSEWTEALLSCSRLASKDEGMSNQFLNAALECASLEQLNDIAQQCADFSSQQQAALIQHLALNEHPRWKSLAAELLARKERQWQQVIPLLSQDASEESLKILCDHALNYAGGLEGTRDASVDGNQMYQTLLIHLSAFVHPECRRAMNRLARDPNMYISELAVSQKRLAFRSSPGFPYFVQESQLRREGKQKEAEESLKLCLEADPLMPEAFVRLASEEMHANRFNEAMQALRSADQLSPEDVETQSMIALVMVRLDDIPGGLAYADKVIAMAPQDWTSLYNGACTYARATESQLPSEAEKKTYADKAIELIRQTATLKFSDSEHMQKDEDLLNLHLHPKWPEVVELVNANKAPAPPIP